jgi:hypothetical protein
MTKLERQLLGNIIHSEYHDGANPVDNPTWVDCVTEGFTGKTASGVMSSLVKKGWARTNGETVTVTSDGFRAYQK